MRDAKWLVLASVITLATSPVMAQVSSEIDAAEKAGRISVETAKQLRADEAKIAERENDLKAKNSGNLKAGDAKKIADDRQKLGERLHKLEATKPDNTGHNLGDSRTDSPTPQVQSESKADLATVQSIRKALVKDKSLSVNAQNVKVIVINGTATLRGVVDSDAEKGKVVAVAEDVVGKGNLLDKLEVKVK